MINVSGILICGCSYTVSLNPGISPTANIANPINSKIGLFIPEETVSVSISDRPAPAIKYTFLVGKSLESIISQSVRRVFTAVEVLEAYPTQKMITERGLNLVCIAKVESANISLNYKQGVFFQSDADGSTVISIQLTFYLPDMIQLVVVRASGMGVASEGWGFGSGEKEFSKSVESAIRSLGDDLVHQIYGNYDIRKLSDHH